MDEELGLRMGTPTQARYEKVLKGLVDELEQLELQADLNKVLQRHCQGKIDYEKETFK